MSSCTPTLDNPLDSVIGQLRHISDDQDLLKSSIDAGSVRRILVHIANINLSVLASTRDHLNATKRLKDFACALTRIAKKSEPPNDVLMIRMAQVAEDLRAASDELARSDAIPSWGATPETLNSPQQQAQLHVWEGEGGTRG